MSRTFNISIAGCSRMAHLHAKAVKNIPNARLTGVWSRTPAKASEFATLHGTKPYTDIKQMVSENKTDLVLVCNWHPYHMEPAIESARAGANVLVEKPLASDLKDCDEMLREAAASNVKLGVISQRRWLEPVRRIKDAIDAGKLGKPALAQVTILGWRDKSYYDSDEWRGSWKKEGGGVLVNQSPHHLDLMLWFMGDVDEVYGIWKNVNHPYIEVEDTAVAIVKFKSGAVGNIFVSNSQKPGLYGKILIHGDNGASAGVQTDGGAMFIAGKTGVAEPPVNDIWTIPGEENMLAEWIKQDTETFHRCDPTVVYVQYQIEDFLKAIENGRKPLADGEAGRKTVELFTAIYRSSRDNSVIKFPLIPEPGLDGRNF